MLQRTPRRTMRVALVRRKWARAKAPQSGDQGATKENDTQKVDQRLAETPRAAMETRRRNNDRRYRNGYAVVLLIALRLAPPLRRRRTS